jgi:hypothetical protein
MRKTAVFLLITAARAASASGSTDTIKLAPNPLDLDLKGYVVRVDSDDIYLDFGDASGAQVGQRFIVYKEGDELMHPVTGQPLGRMEMKLAEGSLREIHGGYSVGAVGKFFGKFGKGVRAKLAPMPRPAPADPAPVAAPAAPAPVTAVPAPASPSSKGPGEAGAKEPRWRSPVFDFEVQGMAVADLDGDGRLELALADDARTVSVYPYPPNGAQPAQAFALPSASAKLLSLEALDVNGNGKAEIFATAFNASLNRVETAVLEEGADGKLGKIAEIAAIVRRYQDGQGKPVLAVQQLEDDQAHPFAAIQSLTYNDGKYGHGPSLRLSKRIEWIYGFTTATLEPADGPRPMFLTPTDSLRVEFKKGHAKTAESVGQTPVRFTWANRVLQCHPHMPARYGEKGFEAVYLAENVGSLGGLAATFGKFSSASIYRMGYNGLGLAPAWKAAVSGYVTDLELVAPSGGAQELVAAVVGTSGKTSLWVYDP